MFRVQGEILIARPVDAVFDFVADESNEPLYNPRMRHAERITPLPIGPGTTFRAEMRGGGRDASMVIEYTRFERPHLIASRTRLSSMDIAGTLAFDAEGAEATRMRWSWEIEPHGVLSAVQPLLARLGRRQERAIWEGLKRILEAGVETAAPR